MKASVVETEIPGNLVKNGKMNGAGGHNGQGGNWIGGGSSSEWYASVTGGGYAGLSDGRMLLETTGNSSFIE